MLFCWFVWLGLRFGLALVRVSFPIFMLCFLPFYDDLGTPPTWRLHSWKKRNEESPCADGGAHSSNEADRSILKSLSSDGQGPGETGETATCPGMVLSDAILALTTTRATNL